jgi:hydrogenase/urease accessory protein HupE
VRPPRAWAALAALCLAPAAAAHEMRPASLHIAEFAPDRYEVVLRTPAPGGLRLPLRLEFPDTCRDEGPPALRDLGDSVVERRVVDAGEARLQGRRIRIAGLESTTIDVVVRATLLDGAQWTVVVRPSRPWVEFTGSKSALEVARAYLLHGVQHIVYGIDHLLFVLGLLLIVRDRWMLVKTITAFTVAHSITLAIATLGYASAPAAPLNAAIALSIVFLGAEVARRRRGGTSLGIAHPWVAAFVFGLLHGFGFASALTVAGLPRSALPIALLTFNVGVEAGQLAFVVLILLLARSFRQLEFRFPAWAAAAPSYAIGIAGAFWTIERLAIMIETAR